jgi:XTP/dITP diphosphohydrolase
MKTIYFVTTNKGKVNSVNSVLSRFNIQVIQEPLEIPELRQDETFRDIAIHKALLAWNKIRKPLIVIDAGLCIPSLNNFPGPYSKYILSKIGVKGIIRLIENKDRYCYFENILAYMDSKLKEPKLFSFKVEGTISIKPRGKMKDHFWSEYFLIFIPKGLNKTLAELEKEKYEKWRAKLYAQSYLTEFGEWFSKRDI